MKIDRRRHYIMMTDTETANTLTRADGSLDMTSVFVYDIGANACGEEAEGSYVAMVGIG